MNSATEAGVSTGTANQFCPSIFQIPYAWNESNQSGMPINLDKNINSVARIQFKATYVNDFPVNQQIF